MVTVNGTITKAEPEFQILPKAYERFIIQNDTMRPASLAVFAFLVALVAYGFMGWLWFLYDTYYSAAGGGTITSTLAEASKIQTVGFLAVIGAFATGLVIFAIEWYYSPDKPKV